MNTTPDTALTEPVSSEPAERVRADYTQVRKLGNWTAARTFTVRARRGHVVLDLRSPMIPAGEIDITVDLDHSMVKLLLPADAIIDDEQLRWIGRGRIKDYQANPEARHGRIVRITGEIRHGEVRVNREGVAVLSAMFTKEYVRDVLAAHREGRHPTIDDPARVNRPSRTA